MVVAVVAVVVNVAVAEQYSMLAAVVECMHQRSADLGTSAAVSTAEVFATSAAVQAMSSTVHRQIIRLLCPIRIPEAFDRESLVGAWHATRDDGSAFSLTLTDDAAFTWNFAQKGQAAQEFGGTYSIEGNVLALERKDGGSLIAEITSADTSMFNFKMLGAAEDDRGLDFNK